MNNLKEFPMLMLLGYDFLKETKVCNGIYIGQAENPNPEDPVNYEKREYIIINKKHKFYELITTFLNCFNVNWEFDNENFSYHVDEECAFYNETLKKALKDLFNFYNKNKTISFVTLKEEDDIDFNLYYCESDEKRTYELYNYFEKNKVKKINKEKIEKIKIPKVFKPGEKIKIECFDLSFSYFDVELINETNKDIVEGEEIQKNHPLYQKLIISQLEKNETIPYYAKITKKD